MDYLVNFRSVQTPLNGQFSIGANTSRWAANRGLPGGSAEVLWSNNLGHCLEFI
jgi:hypothetical protein